MLLADLGSNVAVDVLAGVLLTGLGGAMIWVRSQLKDVGQMTRDWRGVPERPGVSDEIPGVMKRLYTQDQQFKEVMVHLGHQDSALEEIKHEIHPNSGGSIKDAVHRTDLAVEALAADVKGIMDRLEEGK